MCQSNHHHSQHNVDFLAIDPFDSVDMSVDPRVLEAPVTYQGKIFHIEDRLVELTTTGGETLTVRRQVMVHNPCVVMLVHNCERDLYLVEREYRVGPHAYVYGLPAGIMENHEDPHTAALRELREETGIIVESLSDNQSDNAPAIVFDDVAQTYSSEGMTNELANIMVIHLQQFTVAERTPDADEHVHSGWVSWEDLNHVGIIASNATIAIQHERYRRAMGMMPH